MKNLQFTTSILNSLFVLYRRAIKKQFKGRRCFTSAAGMSLALVCVRVRLTWTVERRWAQANNYLRHCAASAKDNFLVDERRLTNWRTHSRARMPFADRLARTKWNFSLRKSFESTRRREFLASNNWLRSFFLFILFGFVLFCLLFLFLYSCRHQRQTCECVDVSACVSSISISLVGWKKNTK